MPVEESAYSPAGDLVMRATYTNGTEVVRAFYAHDHEGRIATLAAMNAANRGFQVAYLNESGCNCGYTLTAPSGATLTRTVTRDPYRRALTLDCTTRFNNVIVASFAYSFDAGNRPVKRNADTFTYNVRDEILSAVIGTNTISHAYDTIGNHTQCIRNGIEYLYANNALNQTTQETVNQPGADGDGAPSLPVTNTLTWSAQGGLQRDGRFIYAFDAEDQLVSATSATLTNGAIRVVNAYDYRHRRISKTVYRCVVNQVPTPEGAPPSPASTTMWEVKERHDFVYDDWNLIHETVTAVDANSTTNVTEVEYFWGPDLSNTLQGAGGVGGLLAVSWNGQFYFPVYDNLGNIVKYIDENGSVVAAFDYDDFGRTLSSLGSMSDVFYNVYKFDVCPLVDEKVSKVLKSRFDLGKKALPDDILRRFEVKPDTLAGNERYMSSDWSPNNNCMTFSFSVMASAAKEVFSDSSATKTERDQARALLALAFLSCWRYAPLDAKLMMDELSSKSKFISKQ